MTTFIKDESILAIIIPYYKIGYLKEVLESLKNQTNQNFNLYIGDDCSPDSPANLIKKYKDELNINYKKFEENLGGVSLTKQWDRCLDMVGDEEWVWVLPDDDIPSENVVEEFYKALPLVTKNNIKIFRFSYKLINEHGVITEDLQYDEPIMENNLDYYLRILKGKTASSLGDNIFQKESLIQSGGFVDFPKAWGSDHATLLHASSGGMIYFLSEATLYFRISGDNISSDVSDGAVKLDARIMFAKWLKNNEHIFPQKPDEEFYRFFYWKAEYYFLNVWKFNFQLVKKLYELRKICMHSNSFIPSILLSLKKIKRDFFK